MQELQIGRVYRHFKGDYYLVEGLAHDSESGASCTGMAACGSARWRCSLAG